jgi:hypothetical protein
VTPLLVSSSLSHRSEADRGSLILWPPSVENAFDCPHSERASIRCPGITLRQQSRRRWGRGKTDTGLGRPLAHFVPKTGERHARENVAKVMQRLKGGTITVLRAEFPELDEFLYALMSGPQIEGRAAFHNAVQETPVPSAKRGARRIPDASPPGGPPARRTRLCRAAGRTAQGRPATSDPAQWQEGPPLRRTRPPGAIQPQIQKSVTVAGETVPCRKEQAEVRREVVGAAEVPER